jgi:putative transcriptional regulator
MTIHKPTINAQHDALLLDYANGTLDPGVSLIIASYLTLSPTARKTVADCETLGGVILETLCEPCSIAEDSLDRILTKIDRAEWSAQEKNPPPKNNAIDCAFETGLPLPAPLMQFLPAGKNPPWEKSFGGLSWLDLDVPGSKRKPQLLQAKPALALPKHKHDGLEITLILQGAQEDVNGRYVRGDLIVMEDSSHHRPVADSVCGCLCLSICANPIQFTGPLMRFLNPLMRRS